MSPTVAIVEDNADSRLLLNAILDGMYDLREYESGGAALDGMARDTPDLVILDISLPGMDGVEVLRRMKQHPRLAHVPAVALTAHAMTGQRETYLAAGFDEYVAKPIVDETELLDAIRRCLSRHEAV